MNISRPHLQGESEVALASSVPDAMEHLALLVRVVALDQFASVEMVVWCHHGSCWPSTGADIVNVAEWREACFLFNGLKCLWLEQRLAPSAAGPEHWCHLLQFLMASRPQTGKSACFPLLCPLPSSCSWHTLGTIAAFQLHGWSPDLTLDSDCRFINKCCLTRFCFTHFSQIMLSFKVSTL